MNEDYKIFTYMKYILKTKEEDFGNKTVNIYLYKKGMVEDGIYFSFGEQVTSDKFLGKVSSDDKEVEKKLTDLIKNNI